MSQKRHKQKKARSAPLKWGKWFGSTAGCYEHKEKGEEVTCGVEVYLCEQRRIISGPM